MSGVRVVNAASPARRPDLVIRVATAADAERLHDSLMGIARTVNGTEKVRCSVADLLEYGFGPDPHFEALVAEVDGAYAGMCLFFRCFSTWLGRPGVYVQDLYVDEAFRSLGVGRKLLRRVAAIARDRDGVYMRLSVDIGNVVAQDFYTRLEILVPDAEQARAAYGEAFLNLAAADCPPGGTLTRGSA